MSIVERALAKAAALGRDAGPPVVENSPVRRTRPAHPAPHARDGATIDLNARVLLEGGLPLLQAQGLLAEELRVIKRPLLLNAQADRTPSVPNGNLLMIGSALPGAGKTFMSLNLAMSMASELDWNVLLIDADVSRPALSTHLGLAEAPGLINLLASEEADLSDFARKTSNPRLNFLPAGPARDLSKELLGSQRMRTLADNLSRVQHHIVIFDSPPLLLTSEARVLASYVGQIVVVVEAGVTPRRSLLDAIEVLDPSKAINLVLNKSRQVFGIGDYHYSGYEPDSRASVDPK